ncbi:MAG: TlpA disulfide reductase family protein [Elusimicrobia bacterium]|nr:TlpA disulfide reductase family protein [Elusimicrobiota bacterium]
MEKDFILKNISKKMIQNLKYAFLFLFLASNMFAAEFAPDFTLSDLNGNKVSLSSQKGNVVFLDFWATWCPPCRASIPEVEKTFEKYKGKNVVFYGINLENDANAVKNFVQKMGIKYTVLVDDNKVGREYGVQGIPAFYIIDQEGKIAERYVGFQNRMSKEWAKKIDDLLVTSSKVANKNQKKKK